MVGKKTGQAAMEYLMTYGWALLVIVIVIAILLIMNPSPRRRAASLTRLALRATTRLSHGRRPPHGVINGNNNAISVSAYRAHPSKLLQRHAQQLQHHRRPPGNAPDKHDKQRRVRWAPTTKGRLLGKDLDILQECRGRP